MYANLAADRPRVTILFTDGAPEVFNALFEDIPDFRKLDPVTLTNVIVNNTSHKIVQGKIADIGTELIRGITHELQREARKMRETYSKMSKDGIFSHISLYRG